MTTWPSRRSGAWGVLLAGSDCGRLRSLTISIEGDERPKQFCRVLGARSLFVETLRRIAPLFDTGRTIAVVTKKPSHTMRINWGDCLPAMYWCSLATGARG
ncbi:MAG: hypothetical protein QM757_27105 [Paludibaculum sp.]